MVTCVPVAAPADASALLAAAWHRRAALHARADLDAYRLFHGRCEGLPGLDIDRYGDLLLIRHSPALSPLLPAVTAALDACRPFAGIFASVPGQEPVCVRGQPRSAALVVQEAGLRFAVQPWRRGNPGLFLDTRPARAWIRAHSQGRTVLNLFAFTGSLGVAAAAGGARRVVQVDSQASALAACRDNHALNDQPQDPRDQVQVNIHQHLRRASCRRQRFDAILLDPPPVSRFARRDHRRPGGQDMSALAPLAADMLAPGGWLLCIFHQRDGDHEALEQPIRTALPALVPSWRGTADFDFPACAAHPVTRFTAFARA